MLMLRISVFLLLGLKKANPCCNYEQELRLQMTFATASPYEHFPFTMAKNVAKCFFHRRLTKNRNVWDQWLGYVMEKWVWYGWAMGNL